MTQIVACITRDFVALAADRRLTDLRSGQPVDDEAAKLVVVGTQMAFAYTGLANVRPSPRGQTDLWLVNVLSPVPDRLPDLFTAVLPHVGRDGRPARRGARHHPAPCRRRRGDSRVRQAVRPLRRPGAAEDEHFERTIEITRALAAELALAGGADRAFVHLTHASADKAWRRTLKRAGIPHPQPTIHDLRHTQVSGHIADGWDPVEIAGRIGDRLATTLAVYSHEFDARRRGDQRRRALEARYDNGMATHESQQTAADGVRGGDETVDLQAVRNRGR